MKIGILQTGETPPPLRAEYGRYPDMFAELFARSGGDDKFVVYDVRRGRLPKHPDDCDGYIITGSRHGVYEDMEWIARLLEYAQTLYRLRRPVAGVCFGHQAIAAALGGRVVKSPKGWGVGLQSWDVLRAAPWMKKTPKKFSLLSFHQDQVIKLPPGSVRLFGSAFCRNAGFAIGNRVFCVQGHPEFVAGFCRDLAHHRETILSPQLVAAAAKPGRNDGLLCARWMRAFFQNAIK